MPFTVDWSDGTDTRRALARYCSIIRQEIGSANLSGLADGMKRLPCGRQTTTRRYLGWDTKLNFMYARRERNWNSAQAYG